MKGLPLLFCQEAVIPSGRRFGRFIPIEQVGFRTYWSANQQIRLAECQGWWEAAVSIAKPNRTGPRYEHLIRNLLHIIGCLLLKSAKGNAIAAGIALAPSGVFPRPKPYSPGPLYYR